MATTTHIGRAGYTRPLPRAHGRLRLSRRAGWLIGLLMLLVLAFAASILAGSVTIPPEDVLSILAGGEGERASWTTIILQFRIPKAVTALLAGAALATAGLLMQTLFRNPLADSYVLGISSGASLGVALVVLSLGASGTTLLAGLSLVGDVGVVVAASLGGAAVLALILLVARRVGGTVTLLIVGLMVGYVTSAFVSLLAHFTAPERLQTFNNWTQGTFAGVTWGQMGAFAVAVLIGLGLAFSAAKPLNALLLGEAYARSMGVRVGRARLHVLTATALLAGAVTAFCGPIGFLGIAVPHLARALLKTSDHRFLLPASALAGAALALVADLIAQVPNNTIILPLNAVMALFGAPVVLAIILRRRPLRESAT